MLVSILDSSDLRENELIRRIGKDISEAAANVISQVSGADQPAFGEGKAPLDPNLICPMCNKQGRIGQIQKYREHVKRCTGTDD